MSFIKAEDLSYVYPRQNDEGEIIGYCHALSNLDFEIEEGEFVALIGHNGSGKSTLARLINGLTEPTGGKLSVAGINVKDQSKIWELRSRVGMVFQNPDNQIIATVVDEDVAFGPENLGVPSAQIQERVDKALETVGMTEFSKVSPGHLSGGQKQRIAIAGALAMKPKCIILDEATAMLDPQGRREVMDVVRKLNKEEHLTVIFITHYMEEAAEADRVIVMDSGKLVFQGSPREVFTKKKELEAVGLELPEVALLACELRQAGLDIPRGILTVDELVSAVDEAKKHGH